MGRSGSWGLTCLHDCKLTASGTRRHLASATGWLCMKFTISYEYFSLSLNSFSEIEFAYPAVYPLKRAIQWLLVCFQSTVSITTVSLTTFSSPPKESSYP